MPTTKSKPKVVKKRKKIVKTNVFVSEAFNIVCSTKDCIHYQGCETNKALTLVGLLQQPGLSLSRHSGGGFVIGCTKMVRQVNLKRGTLQCMSCGRIAHISKLVTISGRHYADDQWDPISTHYKVCPFCHKEIPVADIEGAVKKC